MNKISSYNSYNDILKTLPHSYPFVYVDKIIDIKPGNKIRVCKNISIAECYPRYGENVFPTELLLEVFSQAAILLFFTDKDIQNKKITTLLAGVENFNCYGTIQPGNFVEAEVKYDKVISRAAIVTGTAYCKGEKIADAKFSAAFINQSEEVIKNKNE
ncbi:MAG: hypothetical protein JXB88_09260 [Spirochaetales bacterium]|nr:hypothetical protein [Spirochaetales bacterium]